MLASKAEPTQVGHLLEYKLLGELLAFLANTRLNEKGLPRTLAYYERL